MIAWITCNGYRNTKPCTFCRFLNGIITHCHFFCRWSLPVIKMVHFLLCNQLNCRRQPRRKALCIGLFLYSAIIIDYRTVYKHHACFLFNIHLRKQVIYPCFNVLVAVFVHIKFPILIKVTKSIIFNHFNYRRVLINCYIQLVLYCLVPCSYN